MPLRFASALAWLVVALASCLETGDFTGGGRTTDLPGRDGGALTASVVVDAARGDLDAGNDGD